MALQNNTLILDIGQFSTKIGFAGGDAPSNVFLTMVGEPKYQQVSMMEEKQFYVGDMIGDSVGLYKLSFPIQNGRITDWGLFVKLMDYIFYVLRVDPGLVNVLYATHPQMPDGDKKKLYEFFFEKFQVLRCYFAMDAMLTLYAGGFTTGLVVDIAESSTRVVPFYEGYTVNPGLRVVPVGGADLTRYMASQLQEAGFKLESSVEKQLVRSIKEKACFVSLDPDQDRKNAQNFNKTFRLPDGESIMLNSQRFQVPELLFNPMLMKIEAPSIIDTIIDSLENCDLDVRPALLNNIFLTGGSSMFPNLELRLEHELEVALAQNRLEVPPIRIFAPKERMFSAWVGGSILALIPEFQNSWISRVSYFKNGPPM
ncbi:MAG TPA: actin family protein [Candidatus Lokiarchaeia archaeon]|nr:actin family protein [Candidatus Lokiarchaeia archaeon]